MSALISMALISMAKIPGPKESAELIAKLATHVKVNTEGVKKLSAEILKGIESGGQIQWKEHELHPKTTDETTINWIFLVDSLNFSFWTNGDSLPSSKTYSVTHRGHSYTGYWALCAAINRAIDEGVPITSAAYWANVTRSTAEHLFRGDETDVGIPLLEERVRVMQDSGQILQQTFGGSFANCIRQCGRSAQTLLRIVTENFPSFRDTAIYKGHEVSFLKRAQILVADIWACFEGAGDGKFDDINTLTMFADYRVPQVLVQFGALEYSDHLQQILGKRILLESGDELECEIRGLSIHVVELIREELGRLCQENSVTKRQEVNSVLIDFYLWDYRRQNVQAVDKAVEFHRVRSIYY